MQKRILFGSYASPTARHILTILTIWANDQTKLVWCPQSKLAFFSGRSRRTVQRALEELIERGEIEQVSHATSRQSAHYRIMIVPASEEFVRRQPAASQESTKST